LVHRSALSAAIKSKSKFKPTAAPMTPRAFAVEFVAATFRWAPLTLPFFLTLPSTLSLTLYRPPAFQADVFEFVSEFA
jgi:hypothetical protein